jgi:hypothetical protein
MAPRPIRAQDAQVAKFHRAYCRLAGCGWRGGEHATYNEANAERSQHLIDHNSGTAPGAPDDAARLAALRAAVQRVLDDPDGSGGWAASATCAQILQQAMEATR